MSNSVLNSVFERSQSKGVSRLVLLAIADRADDRGRAFPGTTDICRRTNCCRRAVVDARKELQRIGELVIENEGGSDGERRSHRYLIVLPQPVQGLHQCNPRTGADYSTTSAQNALEPVQGLHPNPNKPSKNPKGAKRERFDAGAVELPFSSEQFSEAWKSWIQHRKEKRQSLTPTATKQQLAKLASIGESRAIAAIEHSIASSYQGIYEPKGGQTEKPRFSPIGQPANEAARRQQAAKANRSPL